jgi:GAF domain-containing protein
MLESMSQRIRKLDGELTRLKKENADLLHVYVNMDEMCRLVLEEARGLIKSENGSLMLLDEGTGTLIIKAAFGVEALSKVRLAAGEGIAGDVLRTGREELVNDVTTDKRFISGGAEISSLLCVPLRSKGSNFGVINLSNASRKAFSLDDLRLLHSLAVAASMAIQNAKILSQLRTATDEILRHATLLHI